MGLIKLLFSDPAALGNIPTDKRRKGLILVSAAGITANIICAFIALLLLQLLAPGHDDIMYKILNLLAYINILLAAFNLIPIPPLDGSKILMGFAPESVNRVLNQIEPFGFFIVIGLLYLGFLNPVIEVLQDVIVNFISLILPAIGTG